MEDVSPAERLRIQDPSSLTTDQLHREVAVMRELVLGLREFLETRLDAMDKAQVLFHEDLVRVPTTVDRQIAHTREWVEGWVRESNEKFHSVDIQFSELGKRSEQTQKDSKVAVDAAFSAQKEAADKSEKATLKQIDQLVLQIQTETRALDGKINDLKERFMLTEGRGAGKVQAETTQQQSQQMSNGVIFGIVGAFVGLAGLVMALLRFGQ